MGRFYDSAGPDRVNDKHWLPALGYAPDAAANPRARALLRNRARYEVANNSYARGIVSTLVNDTIGTGPRLQLTGLDRAVSAEIETRFRAWSTAVGLADTLRAFREGKARDGELFGVLTTNPGVGHPVTLDVRLVAPERVADDSLAPAAGTAGGRRADGISFDPHGNPVGYRVSREHPSDVQNPGAPRADTVAARDVIHYFRADLPGQSRGVPDITPALPVFAQLRRFMKASLTAAETSANIALAIYTEAPAFDSDGGEADAFETMDLDMGTMFTLPAGYKPSQVRAEHPSTRFVEVVSAYIAEAGRCLSMPFNVAAGNSSSYNFASGRLDHKVYFKSISVEREIIGRVVLDRVLAAWAAEAVLVSGYLSLGARAALAGATTPAHKWFWDGFEHVDPLKEASAQRARLENRTTTLAREFGDQGLDWETELEQIAAERDALARLGLDASAAPVAPGAATSAQLARLADQTDRGDP